MTRVSRFEADLLRIASALLGRSPISGVLNLIASRRRRPRCLGRGAIRLLEDHLAKGVVWRLARMGGWRSERFLRGDRVVSGRLWERSTTEHLSLSFSVQTPRFLAWLTARHPGDDRHRWSAEEESLTLGDRLVLYFAYEAMRPLDFGPDLRDIGAIARLGPARLAFPEDFAEGGNLEPPEFTPWVDGQGAFVLEAMQASLARRWEEVERQKGRIEDPTGMIALGREQRAVLDAFLDSIDRAGRLDLSRFLLSAASVVLGEVRPTTAWTGSLVLDGLRLADRAEAHRGALAFLETLDRLRCRERAARSVGYFDEGYAASQLFKADWEEIDGDRLCERAAAVARELDPIGS